MFDGQVKVSGTVRELVFDDTVADIYLGPTLAARLRARFSDDPDATALPGAAGGAA
jgi:lipopolysaccharide export system ATP-binding protein